MLIWDDQQRTLEAGVGDLLEGRGWGVGWGGSGQALLGRARAGQDLHREWQAARLEEDEAFRREARLVHTQVVRGWTCRLTGRADGVSQEGEVVVVEELKSSLMPGEALEHLTVGEVGRWVQQLQLYLCFLEAAGTDRVVGRLVVVSLLDGMSRILHVPPSQETRSWLDGRLEGLVEDRELLLQARARRRRAVVPFPHGERRPGQEQMASQVAAALLGEGFLLLTAPTGTGKTAGVLTGAIRAAYATDQQVFLATARNTQQALAEETLRLMHARGLFLRTVTLRSRARACANQGQVPCHPDTCERARGHLDEAMARRAARRLMDGGVAGSGEVDRVAEEMGLCPHRLAMEMVPHVDVVVGDYNYALDPERHLRRHLGDAASSWYLLVDEAHGLVERARGWLSPELSLALLERARPGLEQEEAAPFRLFLDELAEAIADAGRGAGAASPEGVGLAELDQVRLQELHERASILALDYLSWRRRRGEALPGVSSTKPDPFMAVLDALHGFVRRMEAAGEETVALFQPTGRLALVCMDPAPYLRGRLDRLAGGVCFSATMDPADLYARLLGLPVGRWEALSIESPFDPSSLHLVVCNSVSTRFRHRERDAAATRRVVERVVAEVPGNSAVLFSSFSWRDMVMEGWEPEGRHVLWQRAAMGDRERDGILEAMRSGGDRPQVLLGVLGGIFAEGVDLPGDALKAMVVVGPALPPADVERELVRGWFQERGEDGFTMAYLLPGMTRVVQAAGRVVRSPEDRGVVVLVGQRFAQRAYADYFPVSWAPVRSAAPWVSVREFWEGQAETTGACEE